jgi:hypothetical protein
MKKLQLLSTVAASLLLTAGVVAAQDTHRQMPDRTPAAQQHAPAEKIAPSMHAGERKKPETTGQATRSHETGKAEMKSKRDHNAELKSEHKKSETTGQASKESGKGEMNENRKKSGVNVKENGESKLGVSHKRDESKTVQRSTTGQGSAAGAAKLSGKQRSKITAIIKEKKVRPTHLNISVRVGATLPASVHFYPLPVEVIDIYPQWRGYDYILVGDEIIIINPRTHRIVALLEA